MIVIGEKINASRKSIAKAIASADRDVIEKQIREQDEAGAHYIDLNAGSAKGETKDEIKGMHWLIDIALEVTEKPLSIDSASSEVIEDAVGYLNGRRAWMLNSVKYDKAILDALLPLARDNDTPVIALAMDGEGIPESTERRLEISKSIYEEAVSAGIKTEQIFFDPLVMPLSSNYKHGMDAFEAISKIKIELSGTNTTMGASNISYGLSGRSLVNEAFLVAAVSHGLDSAICDPSRQSIKRAILLGDLIAGNDRHCRRFSKALRTGRIEAKK